MLQACQPTKRCLAGWAHILPALLLLLNTTTMAQDNNRDDVYVTGMFNWIHSTGDAELAFAFYRQVFGMALAHSTFAGAAAANTPPPAIRPEAQAGSDDLVWDLTNTHGSRFRTVFIEAENLSYGLELSEFFDIARSNRPANPWDPGSTVLILGVRDLDDIVTRLRAFGAPVVSRGGVPATHDDGRSILVRDPDGYLVEVRQAPDEAIAAAGEGAVINSMIRISVTDMAQTLAFYEDMLGFRVDSTRQVQGDALAVFGLVEGAATETRATIRGTDISVMFTQYSLPADVPVHAYDWALQDVGSPQFQLAVRNLDALLAETSARGYDFLSVDNKPIPRAFGRFVFVKDPDTVLVEFVEPAGE